jgi:hypothetical protein
MPRVTSNRHKFAYRHPFCLRQLLRQISHLAGKGLAVPALQRLSIQKNIAF